MSTQYRAIAPTTGKHDEKGNLLQQFNGKTCGVRFNEGVGFFNDLTIDKKLGLTADDIARTMVNDFGYQVYVVTDEGEVPFDPRITVPEAPREAVARMQAAALERSTAIASAQGKKRPAKARAAAGR